MESELQRLRFRIRQLEREVRALRNAAGPSLGDTAGEPRAAPRRASAPLFARRRVLKPQPPVTGADSGSV